MTTEELKKHILRIPTEVFGGPGNLDLIDTLVSETFVEHSGEQSNTVSRDVLKQFAIQMRTGFPDLEYKVDYAVMEGDRLVARIIGSGTHTGDYFGIKPTGKHVTWAEFQGGIIKNDQMVEHWAIIDTYGMYKQLGVIAE